MPQIIDWPPNRKHSAVSYVPGILKYKAGKETDADNIPEIKTSESLLLLLLADY